MLTITQVENIRELLCDRTHWREQMVRFNGAVLDRNQEAYSEAKTHYKQTNEDIKAAIDRLREDLILIHGRKKAKRKGK